jgi:hypothetical protein
LICKKVAVDKAKIIDDSLLPIPALRRRVEETMSFLGNQLI